jgi:hypothetical protein
VSHSPFPHDAGQQAGRAAGPQPAAPTQIVFPGQVPLAPQPRYAPAPHQQQPVQYATGFPHYVSPPPSPKSRTGLIVGTVVCLVVLVLAVVGFVLVG